MKRPLALFGLALVAASLVALCSSELLRIIGIVVFALVFAVFILLKKEFLFAKRVAVISAAACLAFFVCAVRDLSAAELAGRCNGSSAYTVCVVDECERLDDNYYRISARGYEIDGEKAHFRVSFFSHDGALPYDRVGAVLHLSYRDGLVLEGGEADGMVSLGASSRFFSFFARLRSRLSAAIISTVGDDEAGVALGMLLGDKHLMSYEVSSALVRSGTSHIVVVSGLHITVLVYIAFKLADMLRVPNAVSCALAVLFAVFTVFLVGFTPSVIRAGVMAVIAYLAQMFDRRGDSLTSLMTAAMIIVLADPSAAVDPSFLLSFTCTFALVAVYPKLCEGIDERANHSPGIRAFMLRSLRGALLPLTATVVTLPVLIFLEMPVSLVSVIANLAVVWLVPAVVVLCAVGAILFWTSGGFAAASALGFIATWAIRFIIWVCTLLSSWRYAALDLSSDVYKIWIVVCAVSVLLWLLFRKRIKPFVVAGLCVVLLVFAAVSERTIERGAVTVTVVGSSSLSLIIEDGREISCFYVGGSEYDAKLIADYVHLNGLDVSFAAGVGQSDERFEYLCALISPELTLSEGDAIKLLNGADSYTQSFSGGGYVCLFREERYSKMIISRGGTDICVSFDGGLLREDDAACEVLIVADAVPVNTAGFTGAIIAADRLDGTADYRVKYNNRVTLLLYNTGRYMVN